VKKFACIAVALMLVPCFAHAYVWRAYNDFNWQPGDPSNNVNQFTAPGEGTASGELIDYDTGLGLGVNLAVVEAQGQWTRAGGASPFVGTDGYNILEQYAGGPNNLESTMGDGDQLRIDISGLDTNLMYNIYIMGVNGNPAYNHRLTDFDLDSQVGGTGGGDTDHSVGIYSNQGIDHAWIRCGENTTNGYVAGWRNLEPGSDGLLQVQAMNRTLLGSSRGYVNSMMIEAIPEPTTVALFGLGGLLLMARRKKK